MDSDMGESRSTKKMKVEQGVKGSLVLKKISFKDEILNIKDALFGRKVSLQLISAHSSSSSSSSSANGGLARGKVGKEAYLENSLSKTLITSLADGDSVTFDISFDYEEEDMGVPGAFMIKNNHHQELYIKTLTLEHVPNHGPVHFICNSWVYPNECYKKPRVFFANQAYLPSKTPVPLLCYREEELLELRGTGTGKLEEYDRVYDYDVYNDLSEPDKGPEYVRPVLGGSKEYPYPRRGRTGRPRTKTDPETESRLPILQSLSIYVPRDERFNALKMSDVYAYGLKLLSQVAVPGIEAVFDKFSDIIVGALEHVLVNHKFDDTKFDEFKSFEDVLKLYEGGVRIPSSPLLEGLRMKIPSEFLRELLRSDGEHLAKFPKPQVIQEDTSSWKTDEEFARQMVAGINPVHIRRLETFPPTSKLDPARYGNQNSTMTREHLIDQLDGLEIDEAIEKNKLFILDHHDPLMPYLRGINETSTKIYATRTLVFLQKDGTLKPVAIELSLPHPDGDQGGAVSSVYTPAGPEYGAQGTIWQLAKAYVAVNDSGYHQLTSHWLHTHAAIEPFIIATNRQLSILHPINKLLQPHFRDTMNINALARQTLINAGGLLEKTVFPDKYSLEMSCAMYKDHWTFPQQALPADLIMRGVAVEDPSSPHGLRLLIEDYPYAVDGLEIWSAIKKWVKDYCSIYYGDDDYEVQNDSELQNWWEEIRNKGHGDKKDEPWWFKMQTLDELIEACTIIIWVASALHAAVNFGQYSYGGYLPNRPATTRRLIPEPGTPEYQELETDPEKAFLKTVTPQLQSILGISLVEILSRHSADEVFLGDRSDSPDHWIADEDAIGAFKRFGTNLKVIEGRITSMNCDEKWRNRTGPAKVPYTLLYPSSEVGLTGKGIPNSVSI